MHLNKALDVIVTVLKITKTLILDSIISDDSIVWMNNCNSKIF